MRGKIISVNQQDVYDDEIIIQTNDKDYTVNPDKIIEIINQQV